MLKYLPIVYLAATIIERTLLILRSEPKLSAVSEEVVRLETARRNGRAKHGSGIVVERQDNLAHLGRNRWIVEYVPTSNTKELETIPINEFTRPAEAYSLKGLSFEGMIKRLEQDNCTAVASLVREPIDILKVFPVAFGYKKYWRIDVLENNDTDLDVLKKETEGIGEELAGVDPDTASKIIDRAITLSKRETDL